MSEATSLLIPMSERDNHMRKIIEERDTYRDLCAELLRAISEINNVNNQIEICKILEDVMSKAESILGG